MVPKQCPWGAIVTNSTLFSRVVLYFLDTKTVPHNKKGTEIAPLGAPNYGQPNSTPRGAVLAPFFLSVGLFHCLAVHLSIELNCLRYISVIWSLDVIWHWIYHKYYIASINVGFCVGHPSIPFYR